MVQVTVYMKVGNVLGWFGLVVLLQEGWQACTEQALHQPHILAHLRKLPAQAELALQQTNRPAYTDTKHVYRLTPSSSLYMRNSSSSAPAQ